MKKLHKLVHCIGCENDFYNGNNPMGIKECWHLKKAKIVWRKEVPYDQEPPWNQKAHRYLECYQSRHCIYVEADRIN